MRFMEAVFVFFAISASITVVFRTISRYNKYVDKISV